MVDSLNVISEEKKARKNQTSLQLIYNRRNFHLKLVISEISAVNRKAMIVLRRSIRLYVRVINSTEINFHIHIYECLPITRIDAGKKTESARIHSIQKAQEK